MKSCFGTASRGPLPRASLGRCPVEGLSRSLTIGHYLLSLVGHWNHIRVSIRSSRRSDWFEFDSDSLYGRTREAVNVVDGNKTVKAVGHRHVQ